MKLRKTLFFTMQVYEHKNRRRMNYNLGKALPLLGNTTE